VAAKAGAARATQHASRIILGVIAIACAPIPGPDPSLSKVKRRQQGREPINQ
jgi:hypothetical protein